MSGTRRIPLNRPAVGLRITERAIDVFIAMGRLKCTCLPPPPEYWLHKMCAGCEKWYDLHSQVAGELGNSIEPWMWPILARQSPKRAGSPTWTKASRLGWRHSKWPLRRGVHPCRRVKRDQPMPSPTLIRTRPSEQSPADPEPLALQLSDTQLSDLMYLCQPLSPRCRDALLRILAHELRGRRDVGDGELHRVARTIIRENRLFDPPLLHRGAEGGKYGR
jgi:hypothetical protein